MLAFAMLQGKASFILDSGTMQSAISAVDLRLLGPGNLTWIWNSVLGKEAISLDGTKKLFVISLSEDQIGNASGTAIAGDV